MGRLYRGPNGSFSGKSEVLFASSWRAYITSSDYIGKAKDLNRQDANRLAAASIVECYFLFIYSSIKPIFVS